MLEHKMLESIIAKYVFIMGNRMRWELKWKNIYVTIKKGMFEQKKLFSWSGLLFLRDGARISSILPTTTYRRITPFTLFS